MTNASMTVEPTITGPGSGRQLCPFTLPDAGGRMVKVSDYRQRANLVLFFHHGANCPACCTLLRDLVAHAPEYHAADAVLLAIGLDEATGTQRLSEAIGVACICLSDPAGRAAERQGLTVPAVVVTDRYGEIWAAWIGGETHRLPTGQDVADWLEFIEIQCPECEATEWPR